MEINGRTRLCGLLANPAGHSMSPMLHGLFAERTHTNLAYCPFEVKGEELQAAVCGAYGLNILGLNVSVPHKQQVMEYIKEVDEHARLIGAVNTLVRCDGGYKGYNTDYIGLKRSLEKEGMDIAGRSYIMIGAGGAAKSAAYLLATEGARDIYLLNRTLDKARELADYINGIAARKVIRPLALGDYAHIPGGGYYAVQTTSAGMYPNVTAAPIEEEGFYRKIKRALDIVYNPARTRFMERVEQAGGTAANGLDMLIFQGAASFEYWNPGIVIEEDILAEAGQKIREALNGNG